MEKKSPRYISLSSLDSNEVNPCEEMKKSMDAIILYRSLYILKKKFDLKREKIRNLYNSFNIDANPNVAHFHSYQVSIENFVVIVETIFKQCNIMITTYSNPKDIFLSYMMINLNKKMDNIKGILNEIKNYITEESKSLVKKYNNLFYEKKIKDKVINNIIDIKQNKNKTKYQRIERYENNNKMDEQIEENSNADEGDYDNEEEKEVVRKIVGYNRKGKIVKTYSRLMNDNLTFGMNKENGKK